MGSVGLGNTAALGAFNNRIIAQGLDLGRCQINQALGVYVADPALTFSAGMIVQMNTTTGLVGPSAGTAGNVLGVAKWNHATALVATVVDEQQIFPTSPSGTFTLANANLVNPAGTTETAAMVRIATAVQGGGTVATPTTDYTINATNGVVTAASNSNIAAGTTVYVTYSYQVSTANLLATYGENFWNNLDEVAQANERVTVITDAELLFTAAYDTSQNYTIGAAVYAATGAGLHGLFTSSSAGSAVQVGVTFQAPSASDQFLGVRLRKQPGA